MARVNFGVTSLIFCIFNLGLSVGVVVAVGMLLFFQVCASVFYVSVMLLAEGSVPKIGHHNCGANKTLLQTLFFVLCISGTVNCTQSNWN